MKVSTSDRSCSRFKQTVEDQRVVYTELAVANVLCNPEKRACARQGGNNGVTMSRYIFDHQVR